jgi:alpha-galactosidase
MIFPARPGGTRLVLAPGADGALPVASWIGPVEDAVDAPDPRGMPLLAEHWRGSFTRPGLRGHRAGRDWSPAFTVESIDADESRLVVSATDPAARLGLRTEIETLPGGALRVRHVLANTAAEPYQLEALEVAVPVPDCHDEILDFTGRHERERTPQRRPIADGLWLRESRAGRPGLDSATAVITGPRGFGFGHGSVLLVAVAWSGNSVLGVQRPADRDASIIAGELLLPGEITLGAGEQYATPWIVVASGTGLDDAAAQLHTWQRTLPAHPRRRPVTLNVWEAVYFDHDLPRLRALADRAARVGVERFVLDDGWFHARRGDGAGLGDWWVDPDVWPDGLAPLADHVHGLGLQFGLWFEPEMVNPDSDFYRAHPDWVLRAGERVPLLQRNQLVADLTNPDAYEHLLAAVDAVLSQTAVDFVKWDHNRDLLDAGSPARGGAPAVHDQTLAFYRLLDELRARHPETDFESCASGGGRIDLGVLEHVQRFWTSDMTDALARQQIQRWTAQLVAPEYLGAHVSSPTSHQTGRTLGPDFRAATALFGSFGIEWDLTRASEDDLDRLAAWVARYVAWRDVLHTGRMVRLDVADPAVLAHGVVSVDRRRALLAHVQLEESAHNRGVSLRVPGLSPELGYLPRWEGPVELRALSHTVAPDPAGPTGGTPVTGAALARIGLWLPRRRPETITLIALDAI